jgi:uncharacterized protein
MAGKAVLNLVQRYLREVDRAGIAVFAGVLYGSYARGNAHEDSDIDVLVVARSAQRRATREIDLLWKLRGAVDYRIEPLLVDRDRWMHDQASPLLAAIRREGQVIPFRNRRTSANQR